MPLLQLLEAKHGEMVQEDVMWKVARFHGNNLTILILLQRWHRVIEGSLDLGFLQCFDVISKVFYVSRLLKECSVVSLFLRTEAFPVDDVAPAFADEGRRQEEVAGGQRRKDVLPEVRKSLRVHIDVYFDVIRLAWDRVGQQSSSPLFYVILPVLNGKFKFLNELSFWIALL